MKKDWQNGRHVFHFVSKKSRTNVGRRQRVVPRRITKLVNHCNKCSSWLKIKLNLVVLLNVLYCLWISYIEIGISLIQDQSIWPNLNTQVCWYCVWGLASVRYAHPCLSYYSSRSSLYSILQLVQFVLDLIKIRVGSF